MYKGKAAITNGKGEFTIEVIDVLPPHEGEVLVQIKASGVCHTDFDSMSWNQKMVMGHEGAGIVLDVGPGVEQFKKGDKVLLNWAIPCGTCFQCNSGSPHLCETQSFVTAKDPLKGHAKVEGTTLKGEGIVRSFNLGTLSEFVLVKKEAVIKFENTIPFTSACIIGCGVMTGYGSVVNAASIKKNSSVTVLGVGGIGLNVIQASRLKGAEKIIAVDINPDKKGLAIEFGATDFVLAEADDSYLRQTAEKVKSLNGGRGTDYAFECTAVAELGAAPLAMIRNGGLAVQVSGIEQEISIDMNLFEWDKTYINPLYGQCNPAVDFENILSHYDAKELMLDELVSKVYALDELNQVFQDMLGGKIAKGVVEF